MLAFISLNTDFLNVVPQKMTQQRLHVDDAHLNIDDMRKFSPFLVKAIMPELC